MTDNVTILDGDWTDRLLGTGLNGSSKTFSNLAALSDTLLQLTDSVSVSSSLNETVNIQGKISYIVECDTLNNTFYMTDKVVGSLDPNDKLVFIDERGESLLAARKEKIFYKIRFQNVGTCSAQRVIILDILDKFLNWESFKIESSSHSFAVSRIENLITWSNTSIELPDSSANLEGSQGYVSFSIYPKETCPPFQRIQNTGAIQFDYNDHVITNTVETIIVPEGELINEDILYVYPNPSFGEINVTLLNPDKRKIPINYLEIVDQLGNILVSQEVLQTESTLDISFLRPGVYFINALAENEARISTKMIKL